MVSAVLAGPASAVGASGARGGGELAAVQGGPCLLLPPSLIFLAVFSFFPIAEVAWASLFRTAYGRHDATFVGLDNYVRVLEDGAFRNAFVNNVLYAIGTILPSLVIALALALLLNGSSRFKAVIRSLVFLPTLIPLVAAAALFSFIFLPGIGLLDHYLPRLALGRAYWLRHPCIPPAPLVG